jgi:hypothetical protein
MHQVHRAAPASAQSTFAACELGEQRTSLAGQGKKMAVRAV